MSYVMPHNNHKLTKADKIKVLKATVETLSFQIKNLAVFNSPLQVKIWRQRRAALNKQLTELKK